MLWKNKGREPNPLLGEIGDERDEEGVREASLKECHTMRLTGQRRISQEHLGGLVG